MSLHERFTSERAWTKGPGIPDGADAERALLGVPEIPHGKKYDTYVPYAQAIELVKQHQPSPLERSKPLRDLRAKVALLCGNISVPVKFFTAVGTPLDIYHGIDAFFEQGTHIATIDVSLRDKESYKADILVNVTLSNEGEISIDEKEMQHCAEQIATLLNAEPFKKAA
jgi:hypothetical protein